MTFPGPSQPGQQPPPPPGHVPQQQPAYPQYGYAVPQGAVGPMPHGAPRPGQVGFAPDGRRLAEFSDRFLAKLIDMVIMMAVSFVVLVPAIIAIVMLLINATQPLPDGTVPDPSAGVIVAILAIYGGIFLLSFLAGYLYEVELTLRKGGQSYGKKAMKIVIAPLEPGDRLTRGVLARRWLVDSVAVAFIPMFQWINGLWQLWDQPYRQCLHDKFAKTVVVKVST